MAVEPPSISLLDRRDVTLVPWVVIAVGAFALALSQALRPAGTEASPHADGFIVPAAIAFGVFATAAGATRESRWGSHLRGVIWTYAIGAALLLVGISVVALLDRGLATVAYTAAILLAPYLGLVFPRTWSLVAMGIVFAVTAVVHIVQPDATWLEALDVFGLLAAGWFTGRLARAAHRRAARQALLLSRSDQLTGTLNRRGFLEQLHEELDVSAAAGEPVSLLVIDLNGFKQINDREGHAAGDELLAWVGATIPGQLPPDAAFGRLGGDEFAMLLPATGGAAAAGIARNVLAAVGQRVGASIGVATRPDGIANAHALLHSADVALYAAKADPLRRVQAVGVPADIVGQVASTGRPRRRTALTFAALRAAGGPPRGFDIEHVAGRTVPAGFLIIALAGAIFVVSTIVSGGSTFFEELIRYGGPPWVLLNVGLGAWYLVNPNVFTRAPLGVYAISVVLVGVGVVAAALSTGQGVASPIIAGIYLKALFDAAMFERRLAQGSLAVLLTCWAIGLVLGPSSSLWAAPFQAVLIVGAYFLGAIGRGAFEEATGARLMLARRDGLTGLLNRRGFTDAVARELETAGSDGNPALSVLTFDLDDFKSVNDTYGHDAGDQLLRAVASATVDTLPGAYAIGRLGGDEFVAALPATSIDQARRLADLLDERLAALVGASIGVSISGEDGDDIDALLSVADHRAYAVKQRRAAAKPPRRESGPGEL